MDKYTGKKFEKGKMIFFFASALFIVSTFIFGYFYGRYQEGVSLFDREDRIQKTFSYAYKENENVVEIQNTVEYPHEWEFRSSESSEELEEYKIASDDGRMVVKIVPILSKRITSVADVLSAQVDLQMEITPKCIGTQKVFYEEGLKEISTYRLEQEDFDEGKLSFKYVQKVFTKSKQDGTESSYLTDYFIVSNPDLLEEDPNAPVWLAEITAEFDGDKTEIGDYIVAADMIVASLRIQNAPFTASKWGNLSTPFDFFEWKFSL